MHADWKPPTVADTKRRFYESFRRPVAGIYNNVIQELLVQQHIMRYNRKYSYDAVRPKMCFLANAVHFPQSMGALNSSALKTQHTLQLVL